MIMNKSLYIVAFSLAFATTGIAQNNEGQDKVIDLGTQTTTELRKTQAVSTIYSDELDKMPPLVLIMPFMVYCRD